MDIFFMIGKSPFESVSAVFIDPITESASFLARNMNTGKLRKIKVDDIENVYADVNREIFERKMRFN